MDATTLLFKPAPVPNRTVNDLAATFAERLALEEQARAHQRRLDRAEQCSDLNTPDIRIRAWEKLHGLRLPSDPTHPVLDVIAVSTRLSLAEVQEEQRARLARSRPATPPQSP